MNKYTLTSILLLNCLFFWAQKNNNVQELNKINTSTNETIYLHTNATTFVSGENLYYKLYCLNPTDFTQSNISKVAYVELVGSENQILFNHKLFLENGAGQGEFFVPPSIATGTYKLIAYTNWMLNKTSAKLFETAITIINPYQDDSENRINYNTISERNSPAVNPDFNLTLNKKLFSNREKVNLTIKSGDDYKKGDYSLSVRKVETLPAAQPINASEFTKIKDVSSIDLTNKLILPELRGEIISGHVSSTNNSFRLNDISVALSIPGKPFEFKLVKTNAEGKFIFNIDKKYTTSNFIIQVTDGYKEEYTVTIDKSNTPSFSIIEIKNDYKLSSDIKSKIEERSIASQIENAYYTNKSDTIIKTSDKRYFYSSFEKDYLLDNYTRFPTFKETIMEITREIYYTKNNNTYTLHAGYRDLTTALDEPALVLVDGLYIQDLTELFDYKAENIDKISIVQGGYCYGGKIFNGVISVISKNNNFKSNATGTYIINPIITMPLTNKSYHTVNYSDETKLDRIPDYRNQLVWLPNVDLESEITFYTSDVSGVFEIVVEGFSKTGAPISIKEIIEVK